MSQSAISIENLSKAYRIGLEEQRHDTLVGSVMAAARYPLKNFHRLRRLNTFRHRDESDDMFWALRDISFDVAEGEVVGIIGRNGAGKSTLLKVLSRITEPTSGRAVIRGRVSSLLEVGTGFHQELTGRENVYMNGTILGMTKREIDSKFEQIVDFSGVETFLDTPIKHYSSGMKVRLAFSVAAHLEPEILIIDEVLAVGDAEFQQRCLGKMNDVAKSGRTVLFVSHNLGAVQQICQTGVLLSHGAIMNMGPVQEVIDLYIQAIHASNECEIVDRRDRKGRGSVRLERIEIHSDVGKAHGSLFTGRPAFMKFFLSRSAANTQVSFVIHDQLGVAVASFHSKRPGQEDRIESGSECVQCTIDELPLLAGRYSITAAAWTGAELQDHVEHAAGFTVENSAFRGRVFPNPAIIPGSICIDHRWHSSDAIAAATWNGN